MVQVQSTSSIINGTVLACLDAQSQLSFCQMAQRPGPALMALAHGHHQGRVCGCVSSHLAGVTQEEGLQCHQYIGTSYRCLATHAVTYFIFLLSHIVLQSLGIICHHDMCLRGGCSYRYGSCQRMMGMHDGHTSSRCHPCTLRQKTAKPRWPTCLAVPTFYR